VYFLSETGETMVLSTIGPSIVARNDLGERALASPAIAGGRIFIRTDGHLFAVGSGTVTPENAAISAMTPRSPGSKAVIASFRR
jgi:hypothetical protein